MKYAFPLKRPLTRGAINFCMGPFVEGSTQIQQYSTRWVAWVATNGIRYAKVTAGVLLDDTAGLLTDLWIAPVPRPAKFSFSFEQDALHALAIQSNPTTIALRRKVSGVPTEYSWTGKSPVLFYNGIVEADTSVTDLVCFYLNAAGTKLLVRIQRDNFGVEYELNTDLTTVMAELHQTDAFKISGVLYQLLWGMNTVGRQVAFVSKPYPPFPEFASDQLSLDSGLGSAVYFSPIAQAFAPGDQLSADNGLASGIYFDMVIEAAAGDSVSMDSGLGSGIYLDVIIEANAPADSASSDSALDSGVYFLQSVVSNAPADQISMDNGLAGGVYSL